MSEQTTSNKADNRVSPGSLGSTTFSVRVASPLDFYVLLPSLTSLLSTCVAAGASVHFLLPFTATEAEVYWRSQSAGFRDGSQILIVATEADDEDEVAGCVVLKPATAPNQFHRADVAKLLVHPNHGKKGLGIRLLKRLEEHALELGRWLLVLDTESGGAAESLYLKNGFVKVGSVPDYALSNDGKRYTTTSFMYKTLEPAPPAMSSVFVDVDQYGNSYYKSEAWVSPQEVASLGFHAGAARKISKNDPKFSQELTLRHEMYATKPVTVEKTLNGITGTMSNLCLKDARILYQSSMSSGTSNYAIAFVRFAIPASVVNAIRTKLGRENNIAPEHPSKSQMVKAPDGVQYIIFTGNISNIGITYIPVADQETAENEVDLRSLLSEARVDVIANIVLKVDLKHGGSNVEDIEGLKYNLVFSPTYVQTKDIADFALDPMPAGFTRVKNAVVPDGQRMGDKMAALLSRISLKGGR